MVSSLKRSRASAALVATSFCTRSMLRGVTARTSTAEISPSASRTRNADGANNVSPLRVML